MDKKINVAITGYIGSGSSAVIDLLKEFDNCGIALNLENAYEHVPFYTNGGLFELGAVLLNVNSPFNSDAAINNFISCSNRLNKYNFGWFGSYKYLCGDKFEKITEEFINKIATTTNGRNCNHYVRVKFSIIKCFLQFIAKIIYNRKIYKLGRKYIFDKKKVYFSMPTQEEFYKAAKEYTTSYFEICHSGKPITIYDHLIWPQHMHLIDKYFDDSFKTIIVERDVRDLYTLNKYYWYTPPVGNGNPLFPTNPQNFCEYWKRVTSIETVKNNDNILKISFEDLVYNYEDTVKKIMIFLGLSEEQHKYKKKYFNPDKSIKNTQSYSINPEWENEADIIYNSISNFCYNFPYKNNTTINEMFDDPDLF